MNYPRVLIGLPTSDVKDYCVERFLKQITNFTYPNYDIFIVDNSKDKKHVKKFHKRGIKAVHEPLNGDLREELARHQNIIREYFLNGDYDYLFMLESDVFTGECIIENMVSYAEVYGAGAVTCTYPIIRDNEPTLCLTSTTDFRGVRSEKMLERSHGFRIMGQGALDISKLLDDPDSRITATGIGCTLFRKEALELVKFRTDLSLNHRAFSDSFIFTDIQNFGFRVMIDSDVICEHVK